MARSSALLVILAAGCYAPRALPSLAPSLSTRVDATPTERPVETWDLDERAAIAYALRHSPELTERADAEQIADAEVGAARQLQNPELRLGQSSETRLLGTSSSFGVALRLHPDAPWTLSARISRARAEREAERALTASKTRSLIAEIKEIYAELAFGGEMQAMLERQLAVLRERNRVLAERMQHATSTRLENLLADHDLADLESTKAEVDLDLVRARSKLAQLAGIPVAQAWRAVADRALLVAVRTGLDAAALTQRALAAQPKLAEASARANAAGADAFQERAKRLPALDWIQIERTTSPEVEWSVGASVTLPLLSLNSGKIAAAAAEHRRYLHDRDRVAAATLHRVREAIEIVESTGKHARELAARLAPLNEQIDGLLEEDRRAATADPVKLLLLEERHVRAQRDLLEASYTHRLALIELELLVGGEP